MQQSDALIDQESTPETGLQVNAYGSIVTAEHRRIREEYERREREIDSDLYAPWQPAVIHIRNERVRMAATMLHRAGVFPTEGNQCLEIGFGKLGWIGELICWGVRDKDLHGIELNPDRVRHARGILSAADLRVGDAARLPWASEHFHLAVASTLFTSILDSRVRKLIADEITRVLAPGGALLWYDFSVNNPKNPHVKKVGRRELRQLFPELEGTVHSLTLAPPVARWLAGKNWTLASLASAIPLFRTHLLAVLVKPHRMTH